LPCPELFKKLIINTSTDKIHVGLDNTAHAKAKKFAQPIKELKFLRPANRRAYVCGGKAGSMHPAELFGRISLNNCHQKFSKNLSF
jgi:hypothetical protein